MGGRGGGRESEPGAGLVVVVPSSVPRPDPGCFEPAFKQSWPGPSKKSSKFLGLCLARPLTFVRHSTHGRCQKAISKNDGHKHRMGRVGLEFEKHQIFDLLLFQLDNCILFSIPMLL